MVALLCDKCGRPIDNKIKIRALFSEFGQGGNFLDEMGYDFCEKCYINFVAWLRDKK